MLLDSAVVACCPGWSNGVSSRAGIALPPDLAILLWSSNTSFHRCFRGLAPRKQSSMVNLQIIKDSSDEGLQSRDKWGGEPVVGASGRVNQLPLLLLLLLPVPAAIITGLPR